MKQISIQIVEDEAIVAMGLETRLKSLGYRVTSVTDNCQDAVAQARRDRPDVVLMDIRLKGPEDGIDAATTIRHELGIPVVFSTAYLDRQRIERSRIAMPFGYVLKPIQSRDLKVTLEMAVYAAEVETERLHMEKELKASEKKYRELVEELPYAMFEVDEKGVVTYINQTACDMFGYTRKELTSGFNLFNVVAENDHERARQVASDVIQGNNFGGTRYTGRKKDGTTFPVLVHSSKVQVDGKNHQRGFCVDLSAGEKSYHLTTEVEKLQNRVKALERENAELNSRLEQDINRQTRDQLRFFSRAVEQSPASIVITDRNGDIEYVNPKFVRLTGYTPDEVIGNNPRVLSSGEKTAEEYRELWETITSGREWTGEFHNCKKNGEKYWELASISPIFDTRDQITHFLAVKEDITIRKEMETSLRDALKTIESQRAQMLRELEQARIAQQALHPDGLPEIPGAAISVKYVSLDQIGGDCYTVFPIDDQTFGIMIADVTGHGVSAALISFLVSGIFSENSMAGQSPKSVIQSINRSLQGRLQPGKFATMFYGVYHAGSKTLTYCFAGHPEGILIRPQSDQLIHLHTAGTVVGMLDDNRARFEEESIQLMPGDKLLLYTDAIIEAGNPEQGILGLEGLDQYLQNNRDLPIDTLLDTIYQFGLDYSDKGAFDDDITLIGLEITGN